MKKTVSATEARVHFGQMLRVVEEEGATYIVNRSGKPSVVVISAAEYERLSSKRLKPDVLAIMYEAREIFRPHIEAGKLDNIEDLIRSEREERDRQIADALR